MGDERLEKLVTNLIEIVGKTNSMMATLSNDMKELKCDIKVMKQEMTELKKKLEGIEGQNELLGKRINRHTHQIADIQEHMDIREN